MNFLKIIRITIRHQGQYKERNVFTVESRHNFNILKNIQHSKLQLLKVNCMEKSNLKNYSEFRSEIQATQHFQCTSLFIIFFTPF